MAPAGGKGSFAPVPVNGGNAPIPAIRGTEIERQGSTLNGNPARSPAAIGYVPSRLGEKPTIHARARTPACRSGARLPDNRADGRLSAQFSAAQKIERLIGLDRCYEILSWPWARLDPLRPSMKMQVIRVVLPIGIKAMLDGSLAREAARERNRTAVLDELACKLSGTAG
jgi:hypothetical protein